MYNKIGWIQALAVAGPTGGLYQTALSIDSAMVQRCD
jgi:hypothetical protein